MSAKRVILAVFEATWLCGSSTCRVFCTCYMSVAWRSSCRSGGESGLRTEEADASCPHIALYARAAGALLHDHYGCQAAASTLEKVI